MQNELTTLTYEIELKPGEKLNIPESILENITTGHWVITIQQKAEETKKALSHDAFLNGYAPEDEGLYDNYPSR
ncbi:hypothetical protein [Nostoc sp. 'Peltigera membranacea cyanobiont' N6]|uniref:hypothetical protein n=1 Tax=Nostoc sp. 'Peltigera membranacea cyanobiont' N6 TaxID=1261031 RepID=UPI000CF315A5|nr:hypothetical protein [Nostoc sp. 'Peltigera membranacea cyanobiont' N6]AVH66814.1 hypothetical protein NPM_5367 [Nostoc sp. 'Peltigera membranacea cyanobiont' N6]